MLSLWESNRKSLMLDNIESNLKKLIAAYEMQRARADRTEKEGVQCKEDLAVAKDKIKELEDRIDNLKLRSVLAPSGQENAEAKSSIQKLIAQGDKALEMLQ